eukprot:SAG22_NODE_5392_length_1022_cov_0.720779_2_plen_144_part_00
MCVFATGRQDVADGLPTVVCGQAASEAGCPRVGGGGGGGSFFFSTDPRFSDCMVAQAANAAGAGGGGGEASSSWMAEPALTPAGGTSDAAAVCCEQLRCQEWLLEAIGAWYLGATVLCFGLALLLLAWSTVVLWLLERDLEVS